jgi:hypothetical protein
VTKDNSFQFEKRSHHWVGGEARVFSVDAEAEFPNGRQLEGARLLTVTYEGGGLGILFDQIAAAAGLDGSNHFQALLEKLSALADQKPLIVYVRHADRLLGDVGPALLHISTFWESFVRHGSGVHSMYLVLETGPRAKVNAAFFPGGKVDWL